MFDTLLLLTNWYVDKKADEGLSEFEGIKKVRDVIGKSMYVTLGVLTAMDNSGDGISTGLHHDPSIALWGSYWEGYSE